MRGKTNAKAENRWGLNGLHMDDAFKNVTAKQKP